MERSIMKKRLLHGFSASLLTIAAAMLCAFSSYAETGSTTDTSAAPVTSESSTDADQYHNDFTNNIEESDLIIPPIPGSGSAETSDVPEEASDVKASDISAETSEAEVSGAPEKTATGPASECKDSAGTVSKTGGVKGAYLGEFTTTAYCNCSKCCTGGFALTYSGTAPKANHTISADISKYPIGTRLMIGDIIYTVEDIGPNVSGNCLDIYFDTHQQALNYGRKTVDVYAVE